MIEIVNLQKSYGSNQVLSDITFTIHDQEIYGIVGQSGAGKSTLLRCINGLEQYNSGSLAVNGVEVHGLQGKEIRAFRKNIGMIFQDFLLMERRTVAQNIAFSMECWGMNKSEINKKVVELAEIVGISEKLNEKPRTLSGGQKQRVAIARALSMDPSILLCDEATSALDPKITKDILALLRNINERLGITIVVVTHEMSVIRQICDRVAILEKGRIAAEGKVEDILLYQPEAFNNLIGENDSVSTPTTGANIRIVYLEKTVTDTVLYNLATEGQIKFSLVLGKLEQYKNAVLGSIVINVAKEDATKALQYLTAHGVQAEVIENE